ncbi:hypothetical protein DERP_015417 [Dermatophagoides pteronyssinus]|uniref:FLYWCH-type domain-containing protein n=1 Tax=Dermatophagoides pteronyssinus TaxID=6956 RepID=A0ABQ8J1J5_DERPT|nr:hypothetical protein DERP_015417 [Dermatophagoides pteronyssinus]
MSSLSIKENLNLIQVNAIKIDNNYTLLRADPFDIGTLEYRNKTEEYCFSKYTGTEYVVYQEKTGCSSEITFHPINEHQTPFHSNGCKKSMKAAKNQWKRYKCVRRDKVTAEEIVQIKMDNQYVYSITVILKTLPLMESPMSVKR